MRSAHHRRVWLVICAGVLAVTASAVAAAAVVHKPAGGQGIPVQAFPAALAVSPNGRTLYIADTEVPRANGVVWPLVLATGHRGPAIGVHGQPYLLVITPDGRTLFASDGAEITPIDVAAGTTRPPIRMGIAAGAPAPLLVSRDGRTLYFAGFDTIRSYDIATGKFHANIRADLPEAMILSRDGKTLWYASFDNQVVAVDLATGTVTMHVRVQKEPIALAMTPNGRTLYVAVTGRGSKKPAELIPVDVATGTAGPGIAIHYPVALAMAPGGRTVYVLASPQGTNGNGPTVPGWVTPINLSTRTAGHPVSVGYDPTSIVITPDGKTLYVANQDSETISSIPAGR
jgi:DNA-binding beta-propeller fold protein YncE